MSSSAWMRSPALLVSLCLLGAGCADAPRPHASTSLRWTAGCTEPAFDPDGPPEVLRAALERALSRGLVDRGADGRIVPAAAERFEWSPDSLTLRFHLKSGLKYTDGSPVTSEDFRTALVAGLGRQDHGTRGWLLGVLQGVSQVRAGRPLPKLGIETPDPGTLVLRLAQRDPHLLDALAVPGVSTPWKSRSGPWGSAIGLGPYRVLRHEAGRSLTLVAADSSLGWAARVDTLRVRYVVGAPRVRTLLRQSATDLVWPLPPGLLEQQVPTPYEVGRLAAFPSRRLLLVFRADVPPMHKLPARHALSHALDRRELLAALGVRGEAITSWLQGGRDFEFPSFDAALVRSWLARGKLGGSFHVTLAYDADRTGAEVARTLQGQWARSGLYAELRAQRGAKAVAEPLAAAAAHAQLVESQAPWPGAAAELATLVLPLRGPAIGSFRTGWRTREFDPAILSGALGSLDPNQAQQRLAEERIVLPVADLPWVWLQLVPMNLAHFDPRTGPDCTRQVDRSLSTH